jgi:hypothetical protein
VSAPDLLVDTSVAVALTLADHDHHREVVHALRDRRLGLAGHAAFETFSVLTWLPPPARRTPAAKEHGVTLCSRDRRALETYQRLDVAVELLTSASRSPVEGAGDGIVPPGDSTTGRA